MADVKGYHLVEQNPSITWDKAAGFNFTKEFEGETKAVRGLFGRYVREGGASSIRFEPDGATAKLYVNYAKDIWGGGGVTESPVEVWELDGNDQEYSLWEHPAIRAVDFTTEANEKYRNEIKKQLEQEVATDDDGDAIEPAFIDDGSCPADLKYL